MDTVASISIVLNGDFSTKNESVSVKGIMS